MIFFYLGFIMSEPLILSVGFLLCPVPEKGNFSCTAATVRYGTVVRGSLRASTGQDWFNSKYSTVVVYLQTVRNVRVDSVQYRNREVSYAREDYDTVLYGCTVT